MDRIVCELCEAEAAHNFHHLIPRTLHSNKWFKKRYTAEQMRVGLHLCKACHRAVHDLVPSEKALGRHYNTAEKLAGHPDVARYLEWKRRRV